MHTECNVSFVQYSILFQSELCNYSQWCIQKQLQLWWICKYYCLTYIFLFFHIHTHIYIYIYIYIYITHTHIALLFIFCFNCKPYFCTEIGLHIISLYYLYNGNKDSDYYFLLLSIIIIIILLYYYFISLL